MRQYQQLQLGVIGGKIAQLVKLGQHGQLVQQLAQPPVQQQPLLQPSPQQHLQLQQLPRLQPSPQLQQQPHQDLQQLKQPQLTQLTQLQDQAVQTTVQNNLTQCVDQI